METRIEQFPKVTNILISARHPPCAPTKNNILGSARLIKAAIYTCLTADGADHGLPL
jgi:hypothetical protein